MPVIPSPLNRYFNPNLGCLKGFSFKWSQMVVIKKKYCQDATKLGISVALLLTFKSNSVLSLSRHFQKNNEGLELLKTTIEKADNSDFQLILTSLFNHLQNEG
ncbi:Uncharacterized protein Fot_57078 [Forsythia ovata]|uniref:Uncharacterized protein n=1 Tax=Forsythia ovata TaxID=205694 RepID=A0ABD1NWZ5_9LAMI